MGGRRQRWREATMRLTLWLYGVVFVVVEMVGRDLELVGWPRVTALEVATAVANALLVVAVGAAVLVACDLLGERWRRSMRAWEREQARLAWARWREQQRW